MIAILVVHQIISAFIHPLRIGWDPALHLQAAQLITWGKVPYVDMLDVNPPLIWYLDAIPAAFSNLFKFPVTQAFSFFLTSVIGYSAFASFYLFTFSRQKRERIFAIPFVLGLILFNFFLRFDSGQREDLFVLLYMPFFVLSWLSWKDTEGPGPGRAIKVLVGFIAGIGICLKPYFLIPAGLVELYWLIDRRQPRKLLRIENLAAASAGLIYVLHFLIVPAEMRENYFGFLVPAFVKGYHFWDTCLANMFSAPDKRNVFFLMVASVVLALAIRKRSALFLPLIIFTLSSNIPYLLQFKGWAYHNQPVYAGAFILAYMAGGLVLYHVGKYLAEVCRIKPSVAIMLIPLAVFAAAVSDLQGDYKKVAEEKKFSLELIGGSGKTPLGDVDSPFLQYFERYFRKGDSAIFMSNGVTPGYPLLTQLSVPPGSRHLHCVILSVLHYIKEIQPQTDKTRELASHMREVVEQYGEDINKNKPKLIFVQIAPVDSYLAPFGFEEKYLSDYEKVDEIANFKVFVRKNNG